MTPAAQDAQEEALDGADPATGEATSAEAADEQAPQHEPDGEGQPGDDPAAAPAGDGSGDVDRLERAVAELTADLQRLQAEYLNYKRRVDRDREVVLQNAKVNVLTALLPVLDDIDRAREHEELGGGFKAVAEGVERVVSGAGLLKFGAPGDEFDPRLHEALSHGYAEPGDGVTTTSCQYVVQAGYQIGDRVVRPAKVTVVEPAPGGEAPSEERTDGTDGGV